MIFDILFSWNELTATMVVWFLVISLTLGIDFGPEMNRERKARRTLLTVTMPLIEQRFSEPQHSSPTLDTETTFQLGVFNIQKKVQRRRHAR